VLKLRWHASGAGETQTSNGFSAKWYFGVAAGCSDGTLNRGDITRHSRVGERTDRTLGRLSRFVADTPFVLRLMKFVRQPRLKETLGQIVRNHPMWSTN
jgi:hypothetical protein